MADESRVKSAAAGGLYSRMTVLGETNLTALIGNMRPTLQPGTCCFCTWSHERSPDISVLGSFREAEGLTLIVDESDAIAQQLQCHFRSAWITLAVHSDLNAVGFLAAISRALAKAGIPCDVVSALYHDHLFVPIELAARAMSVLEELTRTSGEPLDSP